MAGRIVLETERLILREFTDADLDAYYLLGTDPDIIRYTHLKFRDKEHALEILRTNPLHDYQTHGFGRNAVVLKTSGQVIGFSGLKYLPELQQVEIGYRLLPAYWGQGLATEAGRPLIRAGFERLKLPCIIGLVDPENGASVRVLQKLGMKYVDEVEYMGYRAARYAVEVVPSKSAGSSSQ